MTSDKSTSRAFSFESTCHIRIGVFLRYDQTTESLRSGINFPQELRIKFDS